jgi:hypothetical protein
LVDAELAKKGRSYERNQHCLRVVYRDLHDPAAPIDAQADTTDRQGSITKNVPSLRIDHIAEKPLLRVWCGHGLNTVVSQHRNELRAALSAPLYRQVRSECRYQAQFFTSKFWK